MNNTLIRMTTLWGCLLCGGVARADVPELRYIFPPGAERGQSVTVTVSGKAGTAPVETWCSRTDVKIESTDKVDKFKITVPAEAEPGLCWIRLYNAEGASAQRPFLIGTSPEILEQESNGELASANGLQSPSVVVNGSISKAGDVDTFAVDLKAGQTLVAAMTANETLGSPMDGVLQIVSAEGFVLEQNDDDHGLDPLIAFVAPVDGKYFIRTFAFPAKPNQSIRLSGAGNYIYRLTVTAGPYLDHLVPMALGRGANQSVAVTGWNIPENWKNHPVTDALGSETILIQPAGSANSRRVTVEPFATVVENETSGSETGQPIALPTVVTGHIEAPGDVDAYRFQANKGQKLLFGIAARSLGSPLDPVLQLFGPDGKSVKEIDDQTRGSIDAQMDYTTTQAGEYRLQVRDLYDHGGFRYFYRLSFNYPQADFRLNVAADSFKLAAGKPLEIPVTITREHGFAGTIDLHALNLPVGVTAKPVRSLPSGDSAKSVKLVLEGNGSPLLGTPIQIIGRSLSTGNSTRTAELTLADHKKTTTQIWLTVPQLPPKPDEGPVEAKKPAG